jgi:shikimate kinase
MNRRIVIVGFMGCGKTTVGRALAARLGGEMIDLDSLITAREGRSPAEIIQQDGEQAFRSTENRALEDALSDTEARVVALGGGTWTIAGNRELVAKYDCLSVWLDVPFEVCWQRISAGGNTIRPLAPDRETANRLYDSRRPVYNLAQLRVAADDQNCKSIVDKILRES